MMPSLLTSSSVLVEALGSTDLNNVLSEITGLLPTVIPVMIGFIAIRKGLSFLQSVLHSA